MSGLFFNGQRVNGKGSERDAESLIAHIPFELLAG